MTVENSSSSSKARSYNRVFVPVGQVLVSRDLICKVVDAFYTKIRGDEVLGPFFEAKLHGQWQPHLEKMNDFWTNVIHGATLYKGDPVQAHIQVGSIEPQHFSRWLEVFEVTLKEQCASEEQVNAFLQPAKRMATALISRIESA